MESGRLKHAAELRRRAETHLVSAGWLSARELLDDALTIYREEADSTGEIHCLRGLGDVAFKLDEAERAQQLYGQALDAARTKADAHLVAECLFRQGDLLRSLGDHAAATTRLREAEQAYGECGDARGRARCLGLQGEVGREAGAPEEEVLARYRSAHTLQMESGDLRGAAVTLAFIANLLKEREPQQAAAAFVQAARIYEGLGLDHRSEPFLAAARRLDPDGTPPPTPRRPGPWDSEDD